MADTQQVDAETVIDNLTQQIGVQARRIAILQAQVTALQAKEQNAED
ncbi:hypothetical protein [Bifidobacterium boum]|nr:hypothetical protein [Bifidobacterium boum]MCI5861962.1 hypothetical protein [Bifidobacterium boum]